jgi:MraZ protein
MFFGEFEHTIDDKGRLTIPVGFRDELAEGMFVSRGLDGCVFVYPLDSWKALVEKVATLPLNKKDARYFSRLIYSGTECKLDKQGRILLPSSLRQHAAIEVNRTRIRQDRSWLPSSLRKHAAIENEVVIIGVNSRLEIWSKERWQEVTAQLENEGATFAEQLDSLGI